MNPYVSSTFGLMAAISFAMGLNVYATLLTPGVLARTGWMGLPPGLGWTGHSWVLVGCAVLYAAEFVVDKVPGISLAWNGLHTFIRIPIAAVLIYHAGSELTPDLRLALTFLGSAIALAAHASKTGLRLLLPPGLMTFATVGLSTAEDAFAIGIVCFAVCHPLLAALMAVAGLASMARGAVVLIQTTRLVWAARLGRQLGQGARPQAGVHKNLSRS